ncbi:MAG: ATP-dependent DNA helicase RecG [Alphaproteobacteria bacterium]|nr:ATP-dependent DNA helicase RecG [Alphaproteobacteria bacterium]MBN2780203.1 ATP-dependent DNA helicase RecG [Alphaproteobacteria bacterium]
MQKILDFFFTPLSDLKSVAPLTKKRLISLVGERYIDLLLHLPNSIIDRTYSPSLIDAQTDRILTLEVMVEKYFWPPKFQKRAPTKVRVRDAHDPKSPALTLSFFSAKQDYIESILPLNEIRLISGKLSAYKNALTMLHPDYIVLPEEIDKVKGFEPVYPLTHGLSNRLIRKSLCEIFQTLPDTPEWLDAMGCKTQQWPSFIQALKTLHYPQTPALDEHARKRLAYDEVLSSQIALARARTKAKKTVGFSLDLKTTLRDQLLAKLPFKLTRAQTRVISEIDGDLSAPYRMRRLVQGDVGSGKTLVALMAILSVIENQKQAVLMAPTEILANQHYQKIKEYLEDTDVRVAILTGRHTSKERTHLHRLLRFGDIDLLIGTHAVFQDSVAFKDLRLIVVDEQHRFGVKQRLALAEKGEKTDVLAMTATPIPRSLAMTLYGDMDVSAIDERPPGRIPIETTLLSQRKMDPLIERLKTQIAEGSKIYWVCPLVEESEKLDLAAAESRARALQQILGHSVGLIHGRMTAEEKHTVMHDFQDPNGTLKLLVATTVIEVGVDVPEATIMVIEHAERFGLSQLHQLRGRVGRNDQKSACVLLYGTLTPTAKKRLEVMRETDDGFKIAEHDLLLRGAGDVMGTKQSGLPAFKVADFVEDRDLLKMAITEAKYLSENETNREKAIQLLLTLFDRPSGNHHFFAG